MRAVCIHGHFYQPPREDPWSGIVERQPSAGPFHDWNERVTAECYAPNAEARIVDAAGTRVVSNYARLSFDVGPTLHAWLAQHAPRVDRAIVDADRVQHGGIAHGYNHAILPLGDALTKEIQVRWGIRDFERRFGRAPEGLWLPEAAVDTATLEVLVRNGIRFVIVAPHQIAFVRPRGAERWQPTDETSIDTRRSYAAPTPAGDIAVFPYDGALARAVAFEGALHDGRAFGERLARTALEAQEPALVHLATDGESYGHHHRRGEMALAAAFDQIDTRGVAVTTYGAFLAAHPPSWECRIAEGTSWSCVHGIERWRAACGCGGAATSWRGPLRVAVDHLWRAVREGLSGLEDALVAWDGGPTPHALAFETARAAQLAFTSCGWFFEDLDRLEGRQILRYLSRGCQLLEGWTGRPASHEIRAILADARANDGTSGKALFDEVTP